MLLATTLDNVGTSVAAIGNTAWGAGATDNPAIIVGNVIGVLLGVLGLIFLVLVVYAGFLYLTAQGEEKNVKQAKAILTKAVIGMVLIASSYAITNLVVDAVTTISTSNATETP